MIQPRRKILDCVYWSSERWSLAIQGVSLDLVGVCDVADMVRLETLITDSGTLVGGHGVAEANMVRDRRANISSEEGTFRKNGRGNNHCRRNRPASML